MSVPKRYTILWRVAAVLTLVGIAVAVHRLDRNGLSDNYGGRVGFVDVIHVIYSTMISITTTGYGDIAPGAERARLSGLPIATSIRVFAVLLFIGTIHQFVLRRSRERWRMALLQEKLTGHLVVAGFGKTGSEAIDERIARGEDARRIVVIDPLRPDIERAQRPGAIVPHADATRDATLTDVCVAQARAL